MVDGDLALDDFEEGEVGLAQAGTALDEDGAALRRSDGLAWRPC
jgi:hypothetical protein